MALITQYKVIRISSVLRGYFRSKNTQEVNVKAIQFTRIVLFNRGESRGRFGMLYKH